MATKKNAAKGPRELIDWGSQKIKKGGKTTSVKVYSRVIQSAAVALGIKTTPSAKITGATVKKDKKGHLRLSGASISKHGTYLLASTGETRAVKGKSGKASTQVKVWHRVPVPPEVSLAKAVAVLSKTKIKFLKYPNGTEYPIGKGGK